MAALRIPYDCLVLVGDGEKALFLRNHGDEDHLNLVVERVVEAEDEGEDRGRGDADVAAEARPDTAFTHTVADILYKSAHAGKFDRLVVAAPPKVLGLLRKEMHKEVADRLIGEVPKALASHDVDDIQRVLSQHA
jgi:protein required for attachment to host cells